MFDPTARSSGGMIKYYESEETCRQMVEQVIALGIPEVAFYYPMLEEQAPMFERIAQCPAGLEGRARLKARATQAPLPR